MRILIVLLSLLAAPVAVAAEHPVWADLAMLYGQSRDSKAVTKFVREHKLEEITKGPSGSLTPDDHAYSLLYRANRINTVVIKVTPPPNGYAQDNWCSYSETLPCKLVAGDGRPEVVEKLGQPTKPGGDRWCHDGVEVWVFFNDGETGINELYIWPVEKQP